MGFMDDIRKSAECSKDKSISIIIKFGNKDFGVGKTATLRQKPDGKFYFNTIDRVLYDLISYEWDGPILNEITTINTKGSMQQDTVKKGKMGKMTAGALLGTALMPGVGTAVGAAIGAGGKGKTKTRGTDSSRTTQTSTQLEKPGTAILKFKRLADGHIGTITISCNSTLDSRLRCFNIAPNQQAIEQSDTGETPDVLSSLEAIKKLKELLDMGAITKDEFEQKKKQFL